MTDNYKALVSKLDIFRNRVDDLDYDLRCVDETLGDAWDELMTAFEDAENEVARFGHYGEPLMYAGGDYYLSSDYGSVWIIVENLSVFINERSFWRNDEVKRGIEVEIWPEGHEDEDEDPLASVDVMFPEEVESED